MGTNADVISVLEIKGLYVCVAKANYLFYVLGSFELAIVRLSRLIDVNRDQVLYGDVVLPIRDCVHAR